MKRLSWFSLVLLFISCKRQNEPLQSSSIDPALQVYVDRFYAEATERGVTLNDLLNASLTSEIDVCGQGHSPEFNGMFEQPTILINESCWSQLNAAARESLIFHELGHALLNRIHIEGILANGHSKSIMCAGADFDCSHLPDYVSCPEHREYYIDELFDPNTTTPQWANRTWTPSQLLFSDYNDSFSTQWQVFTNCNSNSFSTKIDSTTQSRPSVYSLSLSSSCGEYLTVRRRLDIDNSIGAEAVRLRCDILHSLSGEGVRVSLFVKDNNNTFTSFNRTLSNAIINQASRIDNFTLQAECLDSSADSLIVDFQYLTNTQGELLIGNFEIELMN